MPTPATDTIPLSELRHSLIRNGYRPIPVNGKRPLIQGWQNLQPDPDVVVDLIRSHPDHRNTGILTGDVVAIDIDAMDFDTSCELTDLVLALPGGGNAPCRVGKAPKSLYIFRTDEPRAKTKTGKFLVAGEKCEVEILGIGNQFVAYGIHPETEREYDWAGGEPAAMPFADLPLITTATLDGFLQDATAVLSRRGEPERTPMQDKPSSLPAARYVAPSGDGVWADVKARAFSDLSAWVPQLGLDRLKRYKDGFLAVASFRPSRRHGLADSKRGQALEISPVGICDHSDDNRGYSPIDLVAVCLGCEPTEAADWLAQRVGGETRSSEPTSDAAERLLEKRRARALPVAANDNTPALFSVKRRWNGTPYRRAKGTPLPEGGCARAS